MAVTPEGRRVSARALARALPSTVKGGSAAGLAAFSACRTRITVTAAEAVAANSAQAATAASTIHFPAIHFLRSHIGISVAQAWYQAADRACRTISTNTPR